MIGLKKIGNILSTVLIIVLFIALIAVAVPKIFFGVEMKAVLTPSMEPELPVGSLLVIVPTDYEDIKIGDDITFVRDKNLTVVTHRVIAKNDSERELTTQGIANNTPDKPTIFENVIGKVVYDVPYVGYLVIWTSTLQGKIIAGVIIIAFILLALLLSKSEPKTDKVEKDDDSSAGTNSNISSGETNIAEKSEESVDSSNITDTSDSVGSDDNN